MLRAIWLDRNDTAFELVPRSTNGIANRFLDSIGRTTYALLIGARRRKKEGELRKGWAQNGVFVHTTTDDRLTLATTEELQAIAFPG
jgi:hypothetical protein